ncbi:MAG: transposase, partial [Verrucomicrobiaceae bacterium]|nr:transposase [Verrucomicrobiaceae bacterium]
MKPRKRYSEEFKAQAIELVALGKPVSEVAKDLGIPSDLIYRWRREMSPLGRGSQGCRAVGEEVEVSELRELRREVANLRVETFKKR